MAESQEEKIKKIFKNKGVKIKEVQEILPAKGKGPYYERVRKEPLDQEFIDLIKSTYNLDLVQELKNYESNQDSSKRWEQEYWKATGKIELLEGEIIKHKEKEIELKNKLGELGVENDRLYKEIEKLQARIPKKDTGS